MNFEFKTLSILLLFGCQHESQPAYTLVQQDSATCIYHSPTAEGTIRLVATSPSTSRIEHVRGNSIVSSWTLNYPVYRFTCGDVTGDSIPEIITPPLYKYPPLEFKDAKQKQEWNLLVSNVKKLLPIAKKARFLLIETYEYAETLPDEKSKREHYKLVEKELKEKYSPMVKKMPRSQGRLLVKLVDRECGQSAYAIAKAFVGSMRANLYQGLGLLFGYSLTKHYDPQGDDRMTERVVRLVESGQL